MDYNGKILKNLVLHVYIDIIIVLYYDDYMKRTDTKSHCAINFSLEVFGDSWSLLIVRDIVYSGKKTFKEFLDSEEGISPNILSNRLSSLERKGILAKNNDETDKRKEIYSLTEVGLDLIPILIEMASWGARNDPDTKALKSWISAVQEDRERMIKLIRKTVRNGGSVFVGSDSVIEKMKTISQILD